MDAVVPEEDWEPRVEFKVVTMVLGGPEFGDLGVGFVDEVTLVNEDIPDLGKLCKHLLFAWGQWGEVRERFLEVRQIEFD